MGTPYDLAIPLLGIYPQKTRTLFQKDIHTPMFTTPLFTRAKIWKQPGCSQINEWIKKMWYIYMVKYYAAIKKNEISPLVTT